jgi:phytoene dehydrogenase-like protein
VTKPVIIVGAGLAGLACAHALCAQGQPVQLLEAAPNPGGRVWTDTVDGFLLDRGFQVLNPGYPALQPWLPKLALKPFVAGARVALPNGQFTQVLDPVRHPLSAVASAVWPVGTLTDKWAVWQWRGQKGPLPANLHRLPALPGQPLRIIDAMQARLSAPFIRQFMQPFYGGVLLQPQLTDRWDYWQWLNALFTQHAVCLPQGGMGALPQAMAHALPAGVLQLNTPVAAVAPKVVTLANGQTLPAKAVVVATDPHTANQWVPTPGYRPGQRSVCCLYYAWQGPLPTELPVLWLNGRGEGLINTLCFPHLVQPGYAPMGQALLSVSVLGMPDCPNETLDRLVQAELQDWFGCTPQRLLRVYRIALAQPDCVATQADVPQQVGGIWLAGDWMATPSIQGALASGQVVAQALMAQP